MEKEKGRGRDEAVKGITAESGKGRVAEEFSSCIKLTNAARAKNKLWEIRNELESTQLFENTETCCGERDGKLPFSDFIILSLSMCDGIVGGGKALPLGFDTTKKLQEMAVFQPVHVRDVRVNLLRMKKGEVLVRRPPS